MERCDILVIGGGAAGISAAKAAANAGAEVLLVDNRPFLGGILPQCLHHGFADGKNGPETVTALLADFPDCVRCLPATTALEISAQRKALLAGKNIGRTYVTLDQLILATGSYEIPAGALDIFGTRPEGVYTAGQMQEMLNLRGIVPPGPVVILGSGDLGLIMAAHLAACGISVTIIEQRATCGGLWRNQRCLASPFVKLICQTTITEIRGEKRIENVLLENGEIIPCRTLLIAVGLKPERTLIENLGAADWLHLCGNCRRIQPMLETVVLDGAEAGENACRKWRGSE